LGGIQGGEAGEYTMVHTKKYNQWVKWENHKQVPISDEEAAERADQIRRNLVKLHYYIQENSYESIDDIRLMIEAIENDEELIGFYRYGWVHKYLHIHYPEKISFYHGWSIFTFLLFKLNNPLSDIHYDYYL